MTLPRARIHTSPLRAWRTRFLTQRTALVAIALAVTALFVWPFTLLFRPTSAPVRTCSSATAWQPPTGDVRCDDGALDARSAPLPPTRR